MGEKIISWISRPRVDVWTFEATLFLCVAIGFFLIAAGLGVFEAGFRLARRIRWRWRRRAEADIPRIYNPDGM